MKAIRPAKSPYYPLPPDYMELTLQGKKRARQNACALQETPEDMVWAWRFFRAEYLFPLPEGMWYTGGVVESPPAHDQYIYDIAAFDRNAQCFPRAFGKSKLLKELILLWMFTRPHFKVVLVKSNEDFVEEDFLEFKTQLTENEKIIDDFGILKPRRGSGKWSNSRLHLANGFKIVGRSVMGKLLGLRPDFLAFDDAEFDPAMRVSPTLLTENIKYLYFNHARPMLERGGKVLLVGTLNSRKSFLYYIATTDEKDDPRLGFFNRVVQGAENDGELIWKAKWDAETLTEMEVEMGPMAFRTMMLNDPGTDEERSLALHHNYGYYTVEKEDNAYHEDPLHSQAKLVAPVPDRNDEAVMVSRPFGETVSNMYRILVADPIRKPSATSDWACVMVVGCEKSPEFMDVWWILDMKLGRVKDEVFCNWIWSLGRKWHVRVAGIEAYSTQKKLADQMSMEIARDAHETGWLPRVIPLRYTGDLAGEDRGKPARIMSLGWRFAKHGVRLPRHLCTKHPFQELRSQIENATPDLRLLTHDDAVDTLAMTQFVPRPSGGYTPQETKDLDPMKLLEQGHRNMPGTKVPIIAGYNMDELTPAALAAMEKNRFGGRSKKKRRRPNTLRRMYGQR